MTNVLLLASHAVAEFDDVRMFSDMPGFDVFAPGGYQDPRNPGEGAIRPALPDAPYHPDLIEACEEQRRTLGDPGYRIDWAKAQLHDDLIAWADVIVVHHFPEVWIGGQWDRIRHKSVVWRTCGQSDPRLETVMAPLARQGLRIVRYSPKEREHFRSVGAFAGEDALIRFGKYPDDYGPWTGEWPGVITIAQGLFSRGDATNGWFWREATRGLSRAPEGGPPPPYAMPIGEGSEEDGGPGRVSYPEMLAWLRVARCYLYTGTQPASYTLGLIEAMLTGIPVVSIGPKAWGSWGAAGLFEGHEIVATPPLTEPFGYPYVLLPDVGERPDMARFAIDGLLARHESAAALGAIQRRKAIDLFGVETVRAQWAEFLA